MKMKKCHIAGFFFVLILGTLLHFTYNFSGQNTIVSYFSAVNESVWEHLKLIFFPALIFSVAEYFAYETPRADFWAVKMTSIILAMCFIVIFFYTYSGVLGFNLAIIDVLSFVIADFILFYLSYNMLKSSLSGTKADSLKAVAVLLLFIVCFILWTDNPPDLGIFWG
ncbi:MAG: hypothetical protein IJN40_05210 [Clostridia bacterium]|nr:hypothetical protein [Clostridia bacterium]